MQLDLTVTQVIQFILPTVNAGNKSELVGVVDSVGEALFIDDDIPPIFAESSIFSKAE